MKSIIFAISAVLCLTVALADQQCKSSPCITIDVYYESLCPDSIRFITRQLATTYNGLKDHLNVNLIPYGKANHYQDTNKNWVFTCQHGPSECRGNKAQACGLDAISSLNGASFEKKQSLSVAFVNCVMDAINPASAVPKCAETVGLDTDTRTSINECIRSDHGNALLASLGDKTHALRPTLSFVPTIVLDNVYSQENQNKALYQFKKLICDRIPLDNKPAVC